MAAILNPKKTENKPFNFDLKRMRQAVEAPVYRLPDNLSFKGFQEWMKQKETKD